MKKTICLSSALIIILLGCSPILKLPEQFVPLKTEVTKVEQSASKDADLEEVIIVPPSLKETTIKISKKHQTLKQRAESIMTNAPTHKVESDNPGVKAYQPHKAVWWRWLLLVIAGALFVLTASFTVIQRIANWHPAGLMLKLFNCVRRKKNAQR